ncbi:hypothetical protein [Isoalcanivorax beigongshangi]|uniref:Multidrug transporter n=1 Tax=Isoalcanivorax beigongshangi TaxID=3238810 RepID=A0ABV4ACI7_9GAMM
MSRFKRSVAAGLVAACLLGSMPVAQASSLYVDDRPGEFAVAGDILIARPVLLAVTALGVAAFAVSLPFSALGGNVAEAGDTLVRAPARATFLRCLGCTPEQHQQRQAAKRSLASEQ